MRNTNINEVLFPVELENIYLENINTPLKNFRAVVGEVDNEKRIFSVVTKSYNLVTNEKALEIGKQSLQELLKISNLDSFEVFNVIAPLTKSYVHIDVIHKDYKMNIYRQEVYLPFFRITNSYNKTKSFKIDIGFCRELCDNGFIFEASTIQIKFNHNSQDINVQGISSILSRAHFNRMKEDFENHLKSIDEIQIDKKYFIALIIKILKLDFNFDSKNQKAKSLALRKFGEFMWDISEISRKYIAEFGETGYALFNTITDYSSNVDKDNLVRKNQINRNQTVVGEWLKDFSRLVREDKLIMKDYLKDHEKYLQYSISDNN